MKLAGLILAAGLSSRMGTSKPLLRVGAETFLDRWIGLLAPHCCPLLAVLGHEAAAVEAGIERSSEVHLIYNPHYSKGQLTSLQCGLQACAEAEYVLFTPVDLPAVREETIAALIAMAASRHAPLAMPRFSGKRGHPVILHRAVIDQILELPPNSRADVLIRSHLSQAAFLETADAGILRDVDVPADYESLGLPEPAEVQSA